MGVRQKRKTEIPGVGAGGRGQGLGCQLGSRATPKAAPRVAWPCLRAVSLHGQCSLSAPQQLGSACPHSPRRRGQGSLPPFKLKTRREEVAPKPRVRPGQAGKKCHGHGCKNDRQERTQPGRRRVHGNRKQVPVQSLLRTGKDSTGNLVGNVVTAERGAWRVLG